MNILSQQYISEVCALHTIPQARMASWTYSKQILQTLHGHGPPSTSILSQVSSVVQTQPCNHKHEWCDERGLILLPTTHALPSFKAKLCSNTVWQDLTGQSASMHASSRASRRTRLVSELDACMEADWLRESFFSSHQVTLKPSIASHAPDVSSRILSLCVIGR